MTGYRIKRFTVGLFGLTYYSGWVARLASVSPRADFSGYWWWLSWLVDALTRWSLTPCFVL